MDRLQGQNVDLTKKLGDERTGGLQVKTLGRAHLLHPSLVEDDDLIGHLESFPLIVGHEQAGHMDLVVQLSQPGAKLIADLGVQGSERLVQKQNLRARRQRPRQCNPLPLPPGEPRWITAGVAAQLHELQ